MNKILALILITLVFSSFNLIQSDVYICKGGSSKVYHKSEKCRGLKFCSTNVDKVSEDDAIKLGRRKCKIEN
ncbi:MAG: hypothetical protein K9I82_17230 [Chitinophagaceae bacterium]|nr:hypothetical protein [Chitinophagaceae bacterium]